MLRFFAAAAALAGLACADDADVKAEGLEWLKKKERDEGVVKLPSGLMYKV